MAFDLGKYTHQVNASDDSVPRGVTWVFTGLPKRGKTYGASRWNHSLSPTRTLYLDAEKCVLKWKEYNGMTVIPITSFDRPIDKDGNVKKMDDRGLYLNGEQVRSLSFAEALVLVKQLVKEGELHKNFDIVILDTVDVLQRWAEESYIADLNATRKSGEQYGSIGDVPHGAAWGDARDKLVRPILEMRDAVTSCEVDFGMIIHSKTKTQVDNTYQRDPALRAGVTNALFGEVDAIGYINVEDSHLPNGAEFGAVNEGQLHTISFSVREEILTGGIRLGKLVNKTLPFSYAAIEREYKTKE